MTKLTGAALDRAVAHAMGLKSVNNCEKWSGAMDETQPAQEPLHIVQSNGKHSPLLTHMMSKRTTPPQPAQEPTGMLHIDRLGQWLDASLKERKAQPAQESEILTIAYQSGYYDGKKAAQRTWVGLTDEEMQAVVDAQLLVSNINVYFKAIEAKLKEKNNG